MLNIKHKPRFLYHTFWYIVILNLIFIDSVNSQSFWLTTYAFPGGAKTGLALVNDTTLFIGLKNGIIKSTNSGQSFESVLTAKGIYSVSLTSDSMLYAGGYGKIYKSDKLGIDWDSLEVNPNFPITKIIRNSTGDLFLMTGKRDSMGNYSSAGMYFSNNNSESWQQRVNGINNYTQSDKLTIDKNDRLYLTVQDELVTGKGGLYFSDNNGENWTKIKVYADSMNNAPLYLKFYATSGLTISPDDSLYLSFEGVAANAQTMVNLRKHIDDIDKDTPWEVLNVSSSSMWRLDDLLNDIHFCKNGMKISSTSGNLNHGGTYILPKNGNEWIWINYGLGLNDYGLRDVQYFAETSAGKIFMVQYHDERIYHYTEKTTLQNEIIINNYFDVYPNPAKYEKVLHLDFKGEKESGTIEIFNLSGQKVYSKLFSGDDIEFNPGLKQGMYMLVVRTKNILQTKKIILE